MNKGIAPLAIGGIAVVLVIISAIYLSTQQPEVEMPKTFSTATFSVVQGCRLITPTWAYYKCERRSADNYLTSTFVLPPGFLAMQVYREPGMYCNQADIIDVGIQTCKYKITSQTSSYSLYYKVCSGLPCEFGWACEIGYTGSFKQGETIYAPYGSVITFCSQSALLSQTSYIIEKTWPQKQLIRHTWTGYEAIVKGTGCDIRSVLSSSEWSELPKDAKTSLAIDERVNFIDTFIDVPVLGNYIDNPTYGPVVCGAAGPPRPIYKLKLYNFATGPNEPGKYETTSGQCYYTTEANPVAYWQCCPGETLLGKTCDNSGNWVDLDKGQCCRGGLCTSQLCPGGGSEYCDITTHRLSQFGCRESDGACVDSKNQLVDCCPPAQGCKGDEFCNYLYKCEKKPTGVQACPGECCEGSAYYQDKACADTNKKCCMTASGVGECMVSCEGVEPPVSPPTDEDVLGCWAQCDAEQMLDPLKFVKVPLCKAWCSILAKKSEIIVGAIAAVILGIALGMLSPLFGVIGAIIVFVATLMNIWVGIVLIIIAFILLLVQVAM